MRTWIVQSYSTPRHIERSFLFLAFLLALAMAPVAAAYLTLPPVIPDEFYYWVPSSLGPQDGICIPELGDCVQSCSDYDPNSICAELTGQTSNDILGTCCILESKTYTTDPTACIASATIVRDAGPLE